MYFLVQQTSLYIIISLLLAATNVGDEGGFAPNIQDNKEG